MCCVVVWCGVSCSVVWYPSCGKCRVVPCRVVWCNVVANTRTHHVLSKINRSDNFTNRCNKLFS